MSNFPLLYYLITCFLSCFPPCPSILPAHALSHTSPTFSPLHFSSTTQIFNSLRIFFDTQLIFSTLYSGHTYYYIILFNYLTSCSSTSPIIKINTNQFPSLPQIILGLSHASTYHFHRGVLLLSLSTAFLHLPQFPHRPAGFACPSCLPLTLSLSPAPSFQSLPLPLLSYPYLPFLLPYSDLYLFLSFLFAAVPLSHSPTPCPCLPLLYYLITCFLLCFPSCFPPCPSILPLNPTLPPAPLSPPITIAGQFLTAGFLFPLSPIYSYPPISLPLPLIPPLTFSQPYPLNPTPDFTFFLLPYPLTPNPTYPLLLYYYYTIILYYYYIFNIYVLFLYPISTTLTHQFCQVYSK